MEEILIALIQFFIELTLNVFIQLPFDLPSKYRTTPEPKTVWPYCFGWFVFACILSALSLFVFKHTFISSSTLRVLNLFLTPIVSGFISYFIAKRRSEANDYILPRNHFWQAFWFTLGFVMIRFAYASH